MDRDDQAGTGGSLRCLCCVLVFELTVAFVSISWELAGNIVLFTTFYPSFTANCSEINVLLYLDCYNPLESFLANAMIYTCFATGASLLTLIPLVMTTTFRPVDQDAVKRFGFMVGGLKDVFAVLQAMDIIKDVTFLTQFDISGDVLILLYGDILTSAIIVVATVTMRVKQVASGEFDRLKVEKVEYLVDEARRTIEDNWDEWESMERSINYLFAKDGESLAPEEAKQILLAQVRKYTGWSYGIRFNLCVVILLLLLLPIVVWWWLIVASMVGVLACCTCSAVCVSCCFATPTRGEPDTELSSRN